MVFVKNFKFSHSFFLVKICQLIVFSAVLHREIGFPDHKNGDERKWQNLHLSKGISPWFFSKIIIFLMLSFYSKYAK